MKRRDFLRTVAAVPLVVAGVASAKAAVSGTICDFGDGAPLLLHGSVIFTDEFLADAVPLKDWLDRYLPESGQLIEGAA